MFTPICLFTYNRLNETKQTIESLKRNFLAPESELIIFSDGSKNMESSSKVSAVREYLHTITGFKSIRIIESTENKGLANSIINGVSQILKEYSTVIVLEDDLITAPNFLNFMNQALQFYENKKSVLSISGYSFTMKHFKNYSFDSSFGCRASSWGWAIWKDRWNQIDWDVKDYSNFRWNILKRLKFNRGGSDMARMLDKQMSGKGNSWAIRFCYHQFKYGLHDVFPTKSKIINIGFSPEGSNCRFESDRFKTLLDISGKREFNFNPNVNLDIKVINEFYKHYSLKSRFYDRIKRFSSVALRTMNLL
jgi:hypothetical protein